MKAAKCNAAVTFDEPAAVALNRQIWGHDKVRGTQGTGDNQWFTPATAYFRPWVSARAVRQLHRRFGGFTVSTSSEGLCGCSPSRRSRFALLRIAQRGRCNRSTICDTECVGHKVVSSRSSSSVQRDIAASVMEAPSATYRACRFASRLWRLRLFHMEPFAVG
jgi:hypothetical protein